MTWEDVACGVEARLRVLGPVLGIPAFGVRPRDLTFFAGAGGGDKGSSGISSPAADSLARGIVGVSAAAAEGCDTRTSLSVRGAAGAAAAVVNNAAPAIV